MFGEEIDEGEDESMTFAEKSISVKQTDRRTTQQVRFKPKTGVIENELDLSGKKDRRSTLDKQGAEEERDNIDAESETFLYQGNGDDMGSEINGVSDF